MKSYLFVYGTLLDAKTRNAILGYVTSLHPCKIKGFRMSAITLSDIEYPILIEDNNSPETIQGGYFELTIEDLHKIDAYESNAYSRKQIKLENGLLAWVYYK